jgi:hypothetical protein
MQFGTVRFAQEPLHLQNDHLVDGLAANLTDDRAGKRWWHLARHVIPLGLLVTLPRPLTRTVRSGRRGGVFPLEALGTTAARAKRREIIASRLAAAERDKPVKCICHILCVCAGGVNARKRCEHR